MVRARAFAALLVVGLVLAVWPFGFGSAVAQAQAQQTFTLAPGARAVVTFEAYCANIGLRFPQTLQPPSGLARDPIRAALDYAVASGLTDTGDEALSLQYAVWRLSGRPGTPRGDALTQQIVDAARTAPAAPQGATSLLDAAGAGQVRIAVDAWQPLGEQTVVFGQQTFFRGSGQLTVENIAQQELTLFMPVGTIFPSPSDEVQNMEIGRAHV